MIKLKNIVYSLVVGIPAFIAIDNYYNAEFRDLVDVPLCDIQVEEILNLEDLQGNTLFNDPKDVNGNTYRLWRANDVTSFKELEEKAKECLRENKPMSISLPSKVVNVDYTDCQENSI